MLNTYRTHRFIKVYKHGLPSIGQVNQLFKNIYFYNDKNSNNQRICS